MTRAPVPCTQPNLRALLALASRRMRRNRPNELVYGRELGTWRRYSLGEATILLGDRRRGLSREKRLNSELVEELSEAWRTKANFQSLAGAQSQQRLVHEDTDE